MQNDIIKSSLAYTILGFLPLSFAFVFTPIYLNYMDEAEYGLLSLFMLYSGILAQVFAMGVNHAFIYLYWDVYKDRTKLKSLIASTIGLLFIFQLLFITLGLLFGEQILSLTIKSSDVFTFFPYFVFCLIYASIMIYYEIMQYYYRNEGNLKGFSFLTIGTLVTLTIGTLIGVVFLELKSVGAIYGRTFGTAIIVIIFLLILIKKNGIRFSLTASKKLLLFGMPLFVNAIIGVFVYGIDKILIERLDTIENLGIYSFALVIASVIEILFNALNNAISPTLYKFIKESIDEKINEIRGLAHLIILTVMFMAMCIIALSQPVIDLLIPPSYHQAIIYIPILSVAFFWRIFTSLESLSLYREKKTKYFLFNQSSILVFLICTSFFAYRSFGIIGIVYSLYFSKIFEYIIIKTFSRRVYPLGLKLKRFIYLSILLSLISFVCTYSYENYHLSAIIYVIPLLSMLVLVPFTIRSEIRNIYLLLKNRKALLE